jgi:ADP-ribose pyrophosphatase YjhB (NUDIX family)
MATDNEATAPSRDFTVAVFVVHDDRILLHYHQKLARWLPPGGHIEPGELPDEAALREVHEETGVIAALIRDSGVGTVGPDLPRQLCRPAGIQLENISPGHQHIDLIYFARGEPAEPRPEVGWYGPYEWGELVLTDEVVAWCEAAIRAASVLSYLDE